MTADTQALTILQRSVCLTLSCHYLGNDRHVDLDALELTEKRAAPTDGGLLDGPPAEPAAADKLRTDQLNLTKKLVEPSVIRPARRVISQAKSYLRSRAISAHRVFGERTYLLPIALTIEVDQAMLNFRAQLMVEAQAIADRWATIVAEQAVALGPLFNARDYKTAEEVVAAYGIEWDYVQFGAPDRLETVDRALFEASRDRHDRRMSAAYDEVRLVLRETLRELTAEIARKLEPGADGRPKVFKSSVLTGLADFLSTFELRNIADDGDLAAVVGQIRDLTAGVDRDALIGRDDLREAVRAGMAQAAEHLGELVRTVRRSFDFGEAA